MGLKEKSPLFGFVAPDLPTQRLENISSRKEGIAKIGNVELPRYLRVPKLSGVSSYTFISGLRELELLESGKKTTRD